ncbi:MAG: AMP-binding enzyme, partial [Thermoanaerobaculia bacterium]
AYVVAKPGAQVHEEELKRHCAANLAEFKRPAHIEVRDSLPKTAVGKILRRALREEEATTPSFRAAETARNLGGGA